MNNNDMVMCQYLKNNEFVCIDTWSTSGVLPSLDTVLGGKNDVSSVVGAISTISASGYNSLVTFTIKKDFSNLDKFDWVNFSTWQTNQGNLAVSFGYNDNS